MANPTDPVGALPRQDQRAFPPAPDWLTDPVALAIYERSAQEAHDAGSPEYIEGGSDVSYPFEHRAEAMRYYASECGVEFARVRCTRSWVRVNYAAIADLAYDMVRDEEPEDLEDAIAYTWAEDEGWLYEECKRGDAGAMAFWRCELRSSPPPRPPIPDDQQDQKGGSGDAL